MLPTEIALIIEIDLGEYEFKHLRLFVKYEESRLDEIKKEALEFVQSLENVISYEIAEVYKTRGPQNKKLPDGWYLVLNEFLEKHPKWKRDAYWGDRIA
jgi:hypothetical protein